ARRLLSMASDPASGGNSGGRDGERTSYVLIFSDSAVSGGSHTRSPPKRRGPSSESTGPLGSSRVNHVRTTVILAPTSTTPMQAKPILATSIQTLREIVMQSLGASVQ